MLADIKRKIWDGHTRDYKVTLMVISIFGLPTVFFEFQRIADAVIWKNNFLSKFVVNWGLYTLFAWGIWWVTLGITIESLLIRLENYWTCIFFAFWSIVLFDGLGAALRGFREISFYELIQCVAVMAAICGPHILIVATLIYYAKIVVREINKWNASEK